MRILVIDDDPDVCAIAEFALANDGHAVVASCTSSPRALEQAMRFEPDLILLDVMMPVQDGPATLAQLKAHPSLAHVPVVFLTAVALRAEIDDLKRLGALAVIAKPFDPLTLPHELRVLCGAPAAIPAARRHDVALRSETDAVPESLRRAFRERISEEAAQLAALTERLADSARAEYPALIAQAAARAHKLRGASAILGAPEIASACAHVERIAGEVASTARDQRAIMEPLRALIAMLQFRS